MTIETGGVLIPRFTAKKAYNAFERVLKQAAYYNKAPKYVWIDRNGLQCVTDGFRAYRLGGICQPELPAGLPGPPRDAQPPDLDYFFPPLDLEDMIPLPVPSLDELKEAIKRGFDGHYRYPYDFGEGLPLLNAVYLRDALTLFPDAKLFCYKKRTTVSPVRLQSGYGDAIIFPIRKQRMCLTDRTA